MAKKIITIAIATSFLLISTSSLVSADSGKPEIPKKFNTLNDAITFRQAMSDGAMAIYQAAAAGKIDGSKKSIMNFCNQSVRFKFTWSKIKKQGFLVGCTATA
jgi:hypothetical protein